MTCASPEGRQSEIHALCHLATAIRDDLRAAGISPFSDIPELARAVSLAGLAGEIADRLNRPAPIASGARSSLSMEYGYDEAR